MRVFALTTLAIGTMWAALLSDDFELRNVAEYTSSTLGAPYKITALWGSQAGSLLLWAWIFSGFASLAVYTNRARNRELMPVVVAVLMVIGLFFLVAAVVRHQPLRDPGEPPPPRAAGSTRCCRTSTCRSTRRCSTWAMSGCRSRSPSPSRRWSRASSTPAGSPSIRRWTIFSWLFLGIGILLGAKWAYETLGWGGYWAWDPVENAAFMPWLVATAFLHSVMVQERRGMLKVWNMVLVFLTFSLCLFGTFLTRSGIISSVHAFGESTLGPFFLGLHRRRAGRRRWRCW